MKLENLVLSIAFALLSIKSIECLLWSQFTLLQVVCCVSWPIPFKDPLRKLFFNVGFQFNFGEPFRLSSFYNPMYFPLNNKRSNDGNNEIETQQHNVTKIIDKRERKSLPDFEIDHHLKGKDITAGDFYDSLEDNLESAGYDRSCLMKSVCELSRHPLHIAADEEHLLAEILHFLLTPSEHRGFTHIENYQQEKYETAEEIGRKGGDCDQIYYECEESPLKQMTLLVNSLQ